MVDIGRTKKDQLIFNRFLRIPFDYYKFVHTMFPKCLKAAPYSLSKIITTYHTMLRRNIPLNDYTRMSICGGIPPQYTEDTPKITGKKEILDTLASLTRNFDKLMETGITLYFHSPVQSSAIYAGISLCKEAITSKYTWQMESLPTFFDLVKDFKGDHGDKIADINSADLVCLWMVGTEYPTDFTTAYFKQLLIARKVANKLTVLCSHLTPEEFAERYGKDIKIVDMQFTDENEIDNYKALRRITEG